MSTPANKKKRRKSKSRKPASSESTNGTTGKPTEAATVLFSAGAEKQAQNALKRARSKKMIAQPTRADDDEKDIYGDGESDSGAGSGDGEGQLARQSLREVAATTQELLVDAAKTLEAAKRSLEGVTEKVKEGRLPTANGLEYLEAKLHLLLNYNVQLGYFMTARVNNARIGAGLEGDEETDAASDIAAALSSVGSPTPANTIDTQTVVTELVRTVTALEKTRPLDKKMKYKVDKLLRLAAVGVSRKPLEKDDPLAFKPNAHLLEPHEDSGGGGGGGFSDSDSDGAAKPYRPPMMSAVSLDEKEQEKRDRKEAKLRKRLRKSAMIAGLQQEYSMAPEVASVHGGALRELDDEERHREEYEEANYMRLMTTKKDRQKRKRVLAREQFEGLDNFNDLQTLDELANEIQGFVDDDGGEKPAKRKKKSKGRR